MPMSSEHKYAKLIYRASSKYANWDPEIPYEVGDWGRFSVERSGKLPWGGRDGIFVKEGNIYKDGLADEYDIPEPTEYGSEDTEAVTWIVSQNATALDLSARVEGQTPALANCGVKAGYHFALKRGAILAMQDDSISLINPPGVLRRLLDEDRMRDCVIVSEVHRCSSYARYLSSAGTRDVVIGLKADPPIQDIASAHAHGQWLHSTTTGNFKSKASRNGTRIFCPLFRLVSLKENTMSVQLRGDIRGPVKPLPDAEPPWMSEEDDDAASDVSEEMPER